MRLSDRDLADLVEQLSPVLDAMIGQSMDAAFRRIRRPQIVPGTIASVSGSRCSVETDDDPGTVIEATRTSSAQTLGTRVLVLFLPPAGAYALGPVPQ